MYPCRYLWSSDQGNLPGGVGRCIGLRGRREAPLPGRDVHPSATPRCPGCAQRHPQRQRSTAGLVPGPVGGWEAPEPTQSRWPLGDAPSPCRPAVSAAVMSFAPSLQGRCAALASRHASATHRAPAPDTRGGWGLGTHSGNEPGVVSPRDELGVLQQLSMEGQVALRPGHGEPGHRRPGPL